VQSLSSETYAAEWISSLRKGMLKNCVFGTYRASATKVSSPPGYAPRVDAKRGDSFLQADSLPTRPCNKRKDRAPRAQLPAAIRTHQ